MLGFHIYRIEGDSMLPVLKAGDYILTFKLFGGLKEGDVVVVRHPLYGIIVKRIITFSADGFLWLCGESRASLSPEQIGWVDPACVLGRRLCVISAHDDLKSSKTSQTK